MKWQGAILFFHSIVTGKTVLCLVNDVGGIQQVKEKSESSRRNFLGRSLAPLGGSVLTQVLAFPIHSKAQEDHVSPQNRGGKPFAPLEALLPATRLKVIIDQVYSLSCSLTKTSDKDVQYETIQKMNQLLVSPKLFVSGTVKSKRSIGTGTTAQITTGVSTANKEQYRNNRADLSIPNRIVAIANQADVERQWGMLQYQESRMEKNNEIRASFNYYTSQLEFSGDSYVLTASKEDKKRMIRNEQLPTLTAVITSDLDRRDLYRNQFLTSFDDAKAEVAYQLRQPKDLLDTTDIVELMNQAHTACTEWFALIAPEDVNDALKAVLAEK